MEPKRVTWQGPAGTHELRLNWVPGGSFGFGGGVPRQTITLPGFYIGITQVTQALWQHVMGENPAKHQGPLLPVENISWDHITEPNGFLERINASGFLSTVAEGDAALRFRLPSESEWEYAARGGPHWQDDFAFSGSNSPDDVAWYGPRWNRVDQALVNALGWRAGWRGTNRIRKLLPRPRSHTHPVALKQPNQLGLYDMSGNVWEWCEDVLTHNVADLPADGRPFLGEGTERVLRGGCHNNWDLHCRVWWRYGIQPDAHDHCLGFRLVLTSSAASAQRSAPPPP